METISILVLIVALFALLNSVFTVILLESKRKKRAIKLEKAFEKTIQKFSKEPCELLEVSLVEIDKNVMDRGGETVSSEELSKVASEIKPVRMTSHGKNGVLVNPKTHKMLAKAGIVKAQPTTKKKGDYSKKLSPKDVAAIKRASKKITHRALAKQYGVSEGRIGQIRRSAK